MWVLKFFSMFFIIPSPMWFLEKAKLKTFPASSAFKFTDLNSSSLVEAPAKNAI